MSEHDARIISQAWSEQEIQENFMTLCLKYRGRFSGSSEGLASADFIRDTLVSYGLAGVVKQEFTKTNWQRGSVSLEITKPERISLPCLALPYSASCDREFELVDIGRGMPEDIENAGDNLKGKAVLVCDDNPAGGPHLHRLQKYVDVVQAGAAAFLFMSNSEGMLAQTGSLAFNHEGSFDQVLPAVGMSREVGAELRHWLGQGSVTIKLNMSNSFNRGNDVNVIAEIRGECDPQHELVLCAHYDGHDIAQAAMDNASGTVVVMEVARLLSLLHCPFRRTIKFILFAGEEMGLLGSHHYVRYNQAERDKSLFVMNLDCVGGNSEPFIWLQNASPWGPILKRYVAEIGATINVEEHLVPFSDHFPFMLHGIPGAFCCTPNSGGGRGWGHTIADTAEKVNGAVLKKMAMYFGRIMFRMATEPELPVYRLAPTEVLRSIESRYLKKLLTYEGHWLF